MLTLASSASQEFFMRTIAAIAHLQSQHTTLSLGIMSTPFRPAARVCSIGSVLCPILIHDLIHGQGHLLIGVLASCKC